MPAAEPGDPPSLAREWGVLQSAPRIKLRKEKERTAVFTPEEEKGFSGRGTSTAEGCVPHRSGFRDATG